MDLHESGRACRAYLGSTVEGVSQSIMRRLREVEPFEYGPWICAVCTPDTQRMLCEFALGLGRVGAACHVRAKNVVAELVVVLTCWCTKLRHLSMKCQEVECCAQENTTRRTWFNAIVDRFTLSTRGERQHLPAFNSVPTARGARSRA